MPDLYVIPNWDRDFENSRSKLVEKTTFFCVQNHFDGKKIRRLQGLKKPVELYGTFHAIAAIASKCLYRGVLLDQDGPISAQDLAAKTGFEAKAFTYAFEELSKPGVGLLEKHEIQFENGEWILPEAVKRWAVSGGSRRPLKTSGDLSKPRAASGSVSQPHAADDKADPGNGTSLGDEAAESRAQSSEVSGSRAQPPEAANGCEKPRKAIEEKGREQKSREEKGMPPAVPQGGQSAGTRISNPEIAKLLICEKILSGRDPARPWSYQAQVRLSSLCGAGGIPFQEIVEIAAYRAIPKSDDIPELKARRDPITETSLMDYWGDEAQRAHAYLEKYRPGRNGSAQKKEPDRWQEFFRWKYGDECVLQPSFWKLDEDQQKEWDREHEEFERKNL